MENNKEHIKSKVNSNVQKNEFYSQSFDSNEKRTTSRIVHSQAIEQYLKKFKKRIARRKKRYIKNYASKMDKVQEHKKYLESFLEVAKKMHKMIARSSKRIFQSKQTEKADRRRRAENASHRLGSGYQITYIGNNHERLDSTNKVNRVISSSYLNELQDQKTRLRSELSSALPKKMPIRPNNLNQGSCSEQIEELLFPFTSVRSKKEYGNNKAFRLMVAKTNLSNQLVLAKVNSGVYINYFG